MTDDSKPSATLSGPSGESTMSPSGASATCLSKSPSKEPAAGSTTTLEKTSAGDEKISKAAAAAALKKIGAATTPEAIEAYRTVGRWQVQSGVAEVALASTHQNDDALVQALVHAQNILSDNPDDVVRLKAISQISAVVKSRINNAELTLKCADSLNAAKATSAAPMNRAPQFAVQINVPEKS